MEYGHKFDFLFLQFYNNYCYPGSQYFLSLLNTWLNWARNIANGPLIMLGLPAGFGAAGSPDYNFPPDQLAVAYKAINALTAVGALRALIDFTLSNARRFYSSMGNPLADKGLIITISIVKCVKRFVKRQDYVQKITLTIG